MTPTDERIKYCSQCGNQVERSLAFGKLRPVCPACGTVHFIEPKVAAAVLVEDEGKVLLVQRAMTPNQGKWSLPAGFVDAGEDPQVAAVRECLEETGLQVRVTGLLDVISGSEHPRGADIIIVYEAEIEGGTLSPQDDADDARFFQSDSLPSLAFRATHRAVDLWRSRRG
jgi:8-oxo-dGTP diphosphatase